MRKIAVGFGLLGVVDVLGRDRRDSGRLPKWSLLSNVRAMRGRARQETASPVRSFSRMLKGRMCRSSTLLRTHNACETGTV